MKLQARILIEALVILAILFYGTSPLAPFRESMIEKKQTQIIQQMEGLYSSQHSFVKDRDGKGFGEITFLGNGKVMLERLKEIALQHGYFESRTNTPKEELKGKLFIFEKPLNSFVSNYLFVMVQEIDEEQVRYQIVAVPTVVESGITAIFLVGMMFLLVRDVTQWNKIRKKKNNRDKN